jgi:hypothetical protein
MRRRHLQPSSISRARATARRRRIPRAYQEHRANRVARLEPTPHCTTVIETHPDSHSS